MKEGLLKLIKEQPLIFQSIAIWLIDKSSYREVNTFKKIVLHTLFYLFSLLIFFFILIDSSIRLMVCFLKKGTKQNFDNEVQTGFIYFYPSHYLVLENLIEKTSDKEMIIVSARTLNQVINNQNDNSTVYIDGFIDLSSFFKTIKKIVLFVLKERSETINFFTSFSGFNVIHFLQSILKLNQSIRFKILTEAFYAKYNNLNTIILGNDSCYRAFWLINYQEKKIKSCTVQHGVPENLIQYYSISDYFMAWDSISLSRLIKNPDVTYSICGYPKKRIDFTNFRNADDKSILIVTSKLSNLNETQSLRKIISLFVSYNYKAYIKFHPKEEKKYLRMFKQENIYHSKNISDFSNYHLLIIDTTFAVDFAYNRVNFLPLTFDKSRTFNLYFESVHVNEYISLLERDGSNIEFEDSSHRLKFDFKMTPFKISSFENLDIL